MDARGVDSIGPSAFATLVHQYPPMLLGQLSALDDQRYTRIPSAVAARYPHPFLTKDEVATLVEWKVSHGKFRPTLKALVQQNAEQVVRDTTEEGFKLFSQSSNSVKASISVLTRLRGIGPATASLLLSVSHASTAPFFSDELFRWCSFEEGTGKGWDREIKYNIKEYLQLFEQVHALQQRFKKDFDVDITAVDVEKVAYVLGKQGKPAEAREHGKKRKTLVEEVSNETVEEAPVTKAAKTKSKPQSDAGSSEVRRSGRLKPRS